MVQGALSACFGGDYAHFREIFQKKPFYNGKVVVWPDIFLTE
jgi:hypothetical protein